MGRSIFLLSGLLFRPEESSGLRVKPIDFNIMDVLDWPNFSHDFFYKNILVFIWWFHFFCYIKTNNSLLYPDAVRGN